MLENGIKDFDIICIGAVGIDTNVYLFSNEIDFNIEMNFSTNIDSVGQAGGYSSLIMNNLGLNTGLIGFIGDDFQGNHIKEYFKRKNISVLWFIDPQGTKRSINVMNKYGLRKNFYDGKGSMEVKPDLDLCERFLSQTSLIHVNIVNWSRFLLPIAKKLKLKISCDIQDIVDLNDSYRKDFIVVADILFVSAVNFSDLSLLLKKLRILNENAIIIFAMGNRGAGLCIQGEILNIFPIPDLKIPVIDTNGAGDSLAMGFLSSYLFWNKSVEESLLIGQILARYTCSLKTPKINFLTKDTLLKIFDEVKKDYFSC